MFKVLPYIFVTIRQKEEFQSTMRSTVAQTYVTSLSIKKKILSTHHGNTIGITMCCLGECGVKGTCQHLDLKMSKKLALCTRAVTSEMGGARSVP